MIFKWLIYLLLFYFLYRLFIRPALPGGREDEREPRIRKGSEPPRKEDDEGEYIDYEEVE